MGIYRIAGVARIDPRYRKATPQQRRELDIARCELPAEVKASKPKKSCR
jgi:hypothetical protein